MNKMIFKALLSAVMLYLANFSATALAMRPTVANEQLIKKLAASSVFKAFAQSAATRVWLGIMHRQMQTDEEAATEQARVKPLMEHPAYMLSFQKEELAQAFGYPSWALYEQRMTNIVNLKRQVMEAFPELATLSAEETKSVYEAAFLDADVMSTLFSAPDNKQLEDCFNKVSTDEFDCLIGVEKDANFWYQIAAAASAVCVARAVAAGLIILFAAEVESAGLLTLPAVVTFTTFCHQAVITCGTLGGVAFAGTITIKLARRSFCQTAAGQANSRCIAHYGK